MYSSSKCRRIARQLHGSWIWKQHSIKMVRLQQQQPKALFFRESMCRQRFPYAYGKCLPFSHKHAHTHTNIDKHFPKRHKLFRFVFIDDNLNHGQTTQRCIHLWNGSQNSSRLLLVGVFFALIHLAVFAIQRASYVQTDCTEGDEKKRTESAYVLVE